jgi:hypothetical protein
VKFSPFRPQLILATLALAGVAIYALRVGELTVAGVSVTGIVAMVKALSEAND